MKTIALAAAATFAAAGLAAPALAAPQGAGESVEVRYNDLDLTSVAGRAALDRRLDSAARQVCHMDQKTTGTRVASASSRKCYQDAKEQLRQKVAIIVPSKAEG